METVELVGAERVDGEIGPLFPVNDPRDHPSGRGRCDRDWEFVENLADTMRHVELETSGESLDVNAEVGVDVFIRP